MSVPDIFESSAKPRVSQALVASSAPRITTLWSGIPMLRLWLSRALSALTMVRLSAFANRSSGRPNAATYGCSSAPSNMPMFASSRSHLSKVRGSDSVLSTS
eukprot:scaffold2908_cov257-Pinguiococcus_pyrenoidosus.AAC.21